MLEANLALDAAALVISSGGSTAAAERSLSNILKASGAEKADPVIAAWRSDFIAVTLTEDGKPTTFVRPIAPIAVNLARASGIGVLTERALKKEIDCAELGPELERLKSVGSPYSRWVTVAAAACAAACFSRICGGDLGAFGIAFLAAGLGQLLRSFLQSRKLAATTVIFICAIVSSFIAAFALRLRLSQTLSPALISAVFYMVPGLPLINGFVDVVSQRFLVVGLERIAGAGFVFLILAVGIALAYGVVL